VTLFYPDCSNNNWGSTQLTAQGRQNLLSFLSQLRDEGFAGVSHKMSQGSDFIDPYGALCQTWCDQNSFPFLGYHYVDTSDPDAQAQNWRAAAGRDNAMFDHEDGSGDMDNFWAVTNAFNDVGVNVQLAYIPQWYLNGAGGGGDLSSLADDGILLVSSAYPLAYTADYASTLYDSCGGDAGKGWAPYNGATPSAWQFTSSAIIAGFNGVDCNAYLGADLNVLFGTGLISTPAPPSPTPPPVLSPPVSTTSWTLPTDDSIYAAAAVLVGQFMGTGAASA
jgi:hypothetical protein